MENGKNKNKKKICHLLMICEADQSEVRKIYISTKYHGIFSAVELESSGWVLAAAAASDITDRTLYNEQFFLFYSFISFI